MDYCDYCGILSTTSSNFTNSVSDLFLRVSDPVKLSSYDCYHIRPDTSFYRTDCDSTVTPTIDIQVCVFLHITEGRNVRKHHSFRP